MQDLIKALKCARFAGEQEGCIDRDQADLINSHIETLDRLPSVKCAVFCALKHGLDSLTPEDVKLLEDFSKEP